MASGKVEKSELARVYIVVERYTRNHSKMRGSCGRGVVYYKNWSLFMWSHSCRHATLYTYLIRLYYVRLTTTRYRGPWTGDSYSAATSCLRRTLIIRSPSRSLCEDSSITVNHHILFPHGLATRTSTICVTLLSKILSSFSPFCFAQTEIFSNEHVSNIVFQPTCFENAF